MTTKRGWRQCYPSLTSSWMVFVIVSLLFCILHFLLRKNCTCKNHQRRKNYPLIFERLQEKKALFKFVFSSFRHHKNKRTLDLLGRERHGEIEASRPNQIPKGLSILVDPGNEVRFVQYLIPDPLTNWWSLIGHNTLHYIQLFYLKKVVIFGSCVGIICPPLKWKLILSQGADNVWYWPPPPEVRRMDPSKPSYHVASGK